MSEIYTVIVVILGILAVSGLFVGVTNDAVNFLNSALGSKAASMKTILTVASVGILIGVMVFEVLKICLQFLRVDPAYTFIAQGLVIIVAVALDLRKYLAKK